jgi:hypothetical protein
MVACCGSTFICGSYPRAKGPSHHDGRDVTIMFAAQGTESRSQGRSKGAEVFFEPWAPEIMVQIDANGDSAHSGRFHGDIVGQMVG